MSDRRIDRVERNRDEGVYVSRVQEDKKKHEKFSPLPSKEDKNALIATFFTYLKKMFDTFSPSKKLAGKVIDQQAIIQQLKLFLNLLTKLKKENLSHSQDYATALSNIWIELAESFELFEVLERKTQKEASHFRTLMDQVKNYPADSEHRLGYYLLQHAGKNWLPFPFIEILEGLHKEKTTLDEWSKLVQKIIDELEGMTPFPTSEF